MSHMSQTQANERHIFTLWNVILNPEVGDCGTSFEKYQARLNDTLWSVAI